MKNELRVVLKYKKRDEAREHNISANVLQGSKLLKQKHFSIGRDRNFDEAYDAACIAAQELAKQYKVQFTKPPKSELRDSASKTRAAKRDISPAAKVPPAIAASANQLMEKFGNPLAFRAFIKSAVKLHGVEKIEDVLKSGLEEISSAKEALQNERKIRATANRKIAEAILSARELGVDMESPNEEVTSLINTIIEERERKSNRGQNSFIGRKYVLNGETWDGVGHAPASFAQWLNADPERSIDDLAVKPLT